MAEDQKSQELDLDEFLGVGETPKETPPQDGDSVESATTEETPVEKTDSDGGTTDATEKTEPREKTPEQLKDDRAHWQTKYQEAKSELEQIRDKYASAWESDGKEEPKATTEEKVDTLRTMVGNDKNITDDELREMLRDDPLLAMRVQGEFLLGKMQERLDARDRYERESLRQADMKAEEAAAYRVLNKWRDENKVTDEEFQNAVKSLKDDGIKGRPTAITNRIMQDITYQRFVANAATQMHEVAAEVSQKVKTQALTQQPDAGGKDTEKPKYLEDILADKFGPSKANQALKGLFG